MMFFRNAMILLATTSFSARHAMAQFDFTVDTNNQGQTTPAVVTGNDLVITVGHTDSAGGTIAAVFLNPTCTATVTVATPIVTDVVTTTARTQSSLTNSLPNLAMNTGLFAATTAPAGLYNFCVRFQYTPTGAASYTSFIYIKINFRVTVNGAVTGGIDTEVDGPVNGGVDDESLTVRMFPCDPTNVLQIAGGNNPAIYGEIGATAAVYSQEEKVTMCLEINEPTLAGITNVLTMQFASTPVTQAAFTGGNAQVLTSDDTCSAGGSKHCHFQTTLLGSFFPLDAAGDPLRVDVTVTGTVSVIILANRRQVRKRARLVLQAGETTTKTVGAGIAAKAAAADDKNGGGCSACSEWFFLFKIICWIFKCLLGFS